MTLEENKAIVFRWNNEMNNKGNLDIVDELAADDYIIHPDEIGREEHKKRLMSVDAAFSDGGQEYHDVIAEGDKVVVRWTLHGTHTGEFMGVPPTHKVITCSGINIWRLKNGKIVEEWSSVNMLSVMQQLGLLPPMA